jgi:hypothetical protein
VSRGSIIKRGSTDSIVLDLGRGPDGRWVRRWDSGYRTKRTPSAPERSYLPASTRAPMLSRLGPRWPASLRQQWLPGRVRATTLHSYRTNLERYVLPRIAQVMLQRLRGHWHQHGAAVGVQLLATDWVVVAASAPSTGSASPTRTPSSGQNSTVESPWRRQRA